MSLVLLLLFISGLFKKFFVVPYYLIIYLSVLFNMHTQSGFEQTLSSDVTSLCCPLNRSFGSCCPLWK